MKYEFNKVLVTGAAGFIGYHVSKRLLDDSCEVVGVDNLNDYYDPQLKRDRLAQLTGRSRFRFERLDVASRTDIESLFADANFQCVIHLAAQAGVRYSLKNPHAYIESNVVGFTNILEGCRHNCIGHLVYASSSSVYGANTKLPFSTSDNVDHPVSLYAATKKANELMAHTYSHLYGMPTTGLRFFTVYGPWGRPDMALFKFTTAILEGEPIDVYNNGQMQRDFTYVDDVVECIARVAAHRPETLSNGATEGTNPGRSAVAPYQVLNIGNSHPVQLKDFISAIEDALEATADKRLLPMQLGDVPATDADVRDLEGAVGYRPSTDIRDGVRRFVDWYLDYYRSQPAETRETAANT